MTNYVPPTVHLVLTRPPVNVSDEEFLRWYRGHFPEILRIEGFVGADLYEIDPYVVDGEEQPYRFMAAYELEGDVQAAMDALAVERHSGRMDLPDWFEDFEAGPYLVSWNCRGILGARSAPRVV